MVYIIIPEVSVSLDLICDEQKHASNCVTADCYATNNPGIELFRIHTGSAQWRMLKLTPVFCL